MVDAERIKRMMGFRDGRFYWRARPLSDFRSERAFDMWLRNHARTDVMRLEGRAWNTNRQRQTISIDGKKYPVLDVFWCWHHGSWPTGRVVLEDGISDSFGIDDLRYA